MRTDDFRPSENVEDDREASASRGIPGGRGGLGIGAIVVIFIISWFLGIDPRVLLNGAQLVLGGGSSSEQTDTAPPVTAGTPNDPTGQFVAKILGSTEDTWKQIFAQYGRTYDPPKLRLYAGSEPTPCAFARSAMGPFYCPRDERIYLDTSFFNDIQARFRGCTGKACEFAEAYVIAHEVGHHVQNLLGILPKATAAQHAAGSKADANRIQVRVELQADCLAGVWAHHSDQRWKSIEPGDVEAALQTAAAIGDDRLQQQSRGYVVPDAFTHGTSAQRQRWFTTGLKQGTVAACDTFAAASL